MFSVYTASCVLARTLFITWTLLLFLSDHANSQATSIDDQQTSFDLTSLNKYSGQFTHNIPLYKLTASNALIAATNLTYESSIYRNVGSQNRDAQASPFGLGFAMGIDAIHSLTQGTSTLLDDTYTLTMSGSVHPLYKVDSLLYRSLLNPTITASPVYSTNLALPEIVYWLVESGDGSTRQFGDSTLTKQTKNATLFTYKDGQFLRTPTQPTDTLVASAWLFRKHQDATGHNFIEYHYLHEPDSVCLNQDSASYLSNYYSRALYLKSVTSSTGSSIQFSYEDRDDYMDYWGPEHINSYSTKRLARACQINPAGDTISHKRFFYSYLRAGASVSTVGKLILDSILTFGSDQVSTLPSLILQYHNDSTKEWFGALSSITESMGHQTYLTYGQTNFDSNAFALSYGDTLASNNYNFIERSISKNTFIGKHYLGNDSSRIVVGSWNGFWQVFETNYITVMSLERHESDDRSVFAGTDFVTCFINEENEDYLLVLNRDGGQWKPHRYNPSNDFGEGNQHGGQEGLYRQYSLFPLAENSLLALRHGRNGYHVDGSGVGYYDSTKLFSAMVLRRDPVSRAWTDFWFNIEDESKSRINAVQMVVTAGNTFAIQYRDQDTAVPPLIIDYDPRIETLVGCYDPIKDTLYLESFSAGVRSEQDMPLSAITNGAVVLDGNIIIEPNHDGLGSFLRTEIDTMPSLFGHWEDTRAIGYGFIGKTPDKTIEYVWQSNGMWHSHIYRPVPFDFWNDFEIHAASRNSIFLSGWSHGFPVDTAPYSGQIITTQGSGIRVDTIFSFDQMRSPAFEGHVSKVRLTDQILAIALAGDHLVAHRRTEGGGWSSADTLIKDDLLWHDGVNIGRDLLFVVTAISSSLGKSLFLRYHNDNWDTLDVSSEVPPIDNVFPYLPYEYNYIPGPGSRPRIFGDRAVIPWRMSRLKAFQFIGSSINMPSGFPVLKRMTSKGYPTDPDSSFVEMKYVGGIFNEGSSGNRFAKVAISSTQSAMTPLTHWTTHRFYNDLSASEPTAPTGIRLPDYTDTTTALGLSRDMYLLDGIQFREEVQQTVPSIFGTLYEAESFYHLDDNRLRPLPYRTAFLDSTIVISHDTESRTRFSYDHLGHQRAEERVIDNTDRLIDSLYFVPVPGIAAMSPELSRSTLVRSGSGSRPVREQITRRSYADGIGSFTQWSAMSMNLDSLLPGTFGWSVDSTDYIIDGLVVGKIAQHDIILDSTVQFIEYTLYVDTNNTHRESASVSINGKRVDVLHGLNTLWNRDWSPTNLDSVPILTGNEWMLQGFAPVKQADTITINLYTGDDYCSPGMGFCPDNSYVGCRLKTWSRTTTALPNTHRVTTAVDEGDSTYGYDSLGNQLWWIEGGRISSSNVQADTNGIKLTPDLSLPVAYIESAHPNNVSVFGAEYVTDSTGYSWVTFDGWKNLSPTGTREEHPNVPITSGKPLAGHYAYVLADDASSSQTTLGIGRSFAADSLADKLMRVRTSYHAVNNHDTLILKISATSDTLVSPVFLDSLLISLQISDGWQVVEHPFDLRNSTFDSLHITIGLLNRAQAKAVLGDVLVAPVRSSVSLKWYDHSTYLPIAEINPNGLTISRALDAFGFDTLTLNYDQSPLTRKTLRFSRENAQVYDSLSPNRKVITTYTAGGDSTVAAVFTDYRNRTIQRREIHRVADSFVTRVSDVALIDAIGRPTKAYLPYVDVSGSSALEDYTLQGLVENEANDFYNGIHAPNAHDYPFKEIKYDSTALGLAIEESRPDSTFKIGSSRTTTYEYAIGMIEQDSVLKITRNLLDGSITTAVKSQRGDIEQNVVNYERQGGSNDSTIFTSFTDRYTNQDSTLVDTLPSDTLVVPIKVRHTYRDNEGTIDSVWQIDRGITRYAVNESGLQRFSADQIQWDSNSFVYNKYDNRQRLIEQGIVYDTLLFTRSNAFDPQFPQSTDTIKTLYRWHYDYYIDGTDTLASSERLVRVDNNDQGYYKNYEYFGLKDSVRVTTKLPQAIGTPKQVVKIYNSDGQLQERIIRPRAFDTTGQRRVAYDFDEYGRVTSIAPAYNPLEPRGYAAYRFNALGQIDQQLLGYYKVTEWGLPPTTHEGWVQRMDYAYDIHGRLQNVNDMADVVATRMGGADSLNDNDHYASQTQYGDSENQKTNLVTAFQTRYSTASGRSWSGYSFDYDDRGWLTHAHSDSNASLNRAYLYNALGQRTALIREAGTPSEDTLYYAYDSITPGSSKLLRHSDMAAGEERLYYNDGTLAADSSNGIYELTYDFRNLTTTAKVGPDLSGAPGPNVVNLYYDETGSRLRKSYTYYYLTTCDPDTIIIPPPLDPITMGAGGGGTPCIKSNTVEVHYWYDEGVLLGTFDESDNVIELYVPGPTAPIAVYKQNDDEQLHFFLNDYLGSTRALVKGFTTNAPVQVTFSAEYAPYGKLDASWGTISPRFTYTGHEADSDGDFDYLNFESRLYDPEHGSFTSTDDLQQFANGYMYAGNSPMSVVDPDGKFGIGAILGLINPGFGAIYGSVSMAMDLHELNRQGGNARNAAINHIARTGLSQFVGRNLGLDVLFNPLANTNVTEQTADLFEFELHNLSYSHLLRGLGRSIVESGLTLRIPGQGSDIRETLGATLFDGFGHAVRHWIGTADRYLGWLRNAYREGYYGNVEGDDIFYSHWFAKSLRRPQGTFYTEELYDGITGESISLLTVYRDGNKIYDVTYAYYLERANSDAYFEEVMKPAIDISLTPEQTRLGEFRKAVDDNMLLDLKARTNSVFAQSGDRGSYFKVLNGKAYRFDDIGNIHFGDFGHNTVGIGIFILRLGAWVNELMQLELEDPRDQKAIIHGALRLFEDDPSIR